MVTEDEFKELSEQMKVMHKAILDTDELLLKTLGAKRSSAIAINNLFVNFEKIANDLEKQFTKDGIKYDRTWCLYRNGD